MSFSDNPIRDFERYDAYRESRLDNLPICCCCNQPIQSERAIHIEQGKIDEWYCKECEETNLYELWQYARDYFIERID